MRFVFLGSPPFATPVFARLLGSPHRAIALVSRPDRPSGRGLKVDSSRLVDLARRSGVTVLQPASARDPEFVASLRTLEPDILLVASFGEILGPELLDLAPRGALNVHASLLPRHRGASPIQAAILAGDRETGVSIQRMVLALDEGDVLLEERTEIGERENAGELLDRLAVLGGEAAVRAFDRVEAGQASFTSQDPAQATYARRIRKEQGRIDWTKSAAEIERHVRAMTPWPGARTSAPGGKELVLLDVRDVALSTVLPGVLPGVHPTALGTAPSNPAPGLILPAEGRVFVVTGRGALEVLALKPAAGARMDGAAWLRGARLTPGARLGS